MGILKLLGPVILDVSGFELQPEEFEVIQHPLVGGVIFFRRNFESPTQMENLVLQIRQLRPNIFLAVDQEGGRVQRFIQGMTRLPPLQAYGKFLDSHPLVGERLVTDAAWLMASELICLGLDASFAPVIDVDESYSSVIGDRSFSSAHRVVEHLGAAYIKGMKEAGMAATLKHFPGHGAVKEDSHHELPVDQRDFNDIRLTDLVPFKNLLPLASGVMPAHIQFPKVDHRPVGFSPVWLKDILRTQLQFQGVVFSDDLSMEAAAVVGDHCDRAEAALAAGCDVVLICNQPQKAHQVLDRLSQKNFNATNRLAEMSVQAGISRISLSHLQQSERWKSTSKALMALAESA